MRRSSGIGTLVTSILLIAAAAGAVIYRQDLIDWWRLRDYTPPVEVALIADQAGVTDYARKVFYVARPAVEDSEAFRQHCNRQAEKTIVLGCYNGRNIYIYNVTDPQLTGVRQVTAMHEMLHAAYDRLSKGEKSEVNSWLQAQLKSMDNAHVNELVAQYQKSEPKEIDNELHSILGTEVEVLSPQLETYYQKYFKDRQKVVDFANRYEAAFQESERKIAGIDGQLSSLKYQIDFNNNQLKNERETIESEDAQLDGLRASGDVDAYNSAASAFNAKVNSYNARILETKRLVEQYNALVEERNQLATAHNNLANSLNSNYNPIPAQ